VFPPREDLQLGDVYLINAKTREDEKKEFQTEGYLEFDMWLRSIDLSAELESHYKTRHEFPVTPDPTKQTDGPTERAEAKTVGGADVFKKRDIRDRLSAVAFPEFSFVAATAAEARGMIPISGLPVKLGGSYSKIEGGSLKLRASEYYGLPADIADTAIRTLDENKVPKLVSGMSESMQQLWLNSGRLARVVTEVYLTREIEMTAYFREGGGASAGVNLFEPSGNGLPTTPKPEDNPQKEADDRVAKVNATLKAQTGPGGYLQIVSTSSTHITMKRVFHRPIVIGVRCLTYRLNNPGVFELVAPWDAPNLAGVKGIPAQ